MTVVHRFFSSGHNGGSGEVYSVNLVRMVAIRRQ